ncbi:ankyrin repeat-containing domain protein [Staphylotrichum tortipilum]|uniref:Ankyrin repeat-containing domain protein n=1 Tax=Staphylotrichum tortipilum TaxID=2831512 RepID=A0AAN6MQ49_9PEZI|nr:ankyrin repeat-containing domain protein [Staphylotrichum longicolle]
MASNGDGNRKRWSGLRTSVGNMFKSPRTRGHSGAGPVEDTPLPHDGNNAEKPDAMPMIHEAIRANDLIGVGRILQAFPGVVHETDDQGMTPLALAFVHGNLGMVKGIHTAGASPYPSKNNDESLAALATIAQSAPLIRWLSTLHDRSLLNARDLAGSTPLHSAVLHGNLEVTRALLECGADPNLHAHRATNPPTDPPLGTGTPLFFAVDKSLNLSQPPSTRLATVRLLLQHGASLTIPQELDGTFPLHEAVLGGGAPAVQGGGDPDIITALLDHKDAATGQPATDIEIGTVTPRDPDMRGTTPLMYAAGSCSKFIVNLLLGRGADPARVNALGETALHWAGVNEARSTAGVPEAEGIIRLLVEGGRGCLGKVVGVDVRNKLGGTALHGAAYKGLMPNVRVLLEFGADTRIVAEDVHFENLVGVGGTPEELARSQGHFEVAEFIREWERSHPKGEGGGRDGERKGGEGRGREGISGQEDGRA